MKKTMIRVAAFVLVMLMMVAPAATAEMQRGSRGSEVTDLQQLLFESGWLFETPDGVFGKNTEAAVKAFEQYAGLPVDGIADDQVLYELAFSLQERYREDGFVSSYFGRDIVGYITGVPSEELEEDKVGMEFAEYCVQSTELDGSSRIDYCELHHTMHVETYRMLDSGDPERAQAASDMWYEEVSGLYEQLMDILPAEAKGGIAANRATFMASVEAQRVTVTSGKPSAAMIIRTEKSVCQTIRNQAAWLCGMIWEQQNGGIVTEETAPQKPIILNSSVIIDGDTIYYSGNMEGEGIGIYAMHADGSDMRKLSDIHASLKAVSNGNLLVWHYADDGDGMMKILRTDGTLENVFYTNCHAIAADGRFYFGGSSIAEDSSDHQWLLTSDPQYHDWFYPVDVVDGFMYFIDANGAFEYRDSEGRILPTGNVTLNRLSLKSGNISVLSGAGTNYLGIEDGVLYYTREDFDEYDDNSGNTFKIDVDDGLYAMDLKTLDETMIAELSDDLLTFEFYTLLKDGVIYGEYSDYNADEPIFKILRRSVNGDELRALDMGNAETICYAAENGVVYGMQGVFTEEGDDFRYDEYIVAYDVLTDKMAAAVMDEGETLSYAEIRPQIAVANKHIYYYVMNKENGALSLKCMDLNCGNTETLVTSEPMY